MDNKFLRVDVVETFDQLLEEILGIIFLQSSTLSHVCEQVATLTQLHDEANMLLGFEAIIKSHNVVMITVFQDSHFLHHSLFLFFLVSENLLFDGLDSDKMLTNLVACQVDLAESASSQDSTDSIEVTGARLDGSILFKVHLNLLLQFLDVLVVLFNLGLRRGLGWYVIIF